MAGTSRSTLRTPPAPRSSELVHQELATAIRETVRLQKAARECRQALRALQDEAGDELGFYTLTVGERVDVMAIVEFLHLAIGPRTDREIRITVTAPSSERDAQAQGDANGTVVQR